MTFQEMQQLENKALKEVFGDCTAEPSENPFDRDLAEPTDQDIEEVIRQMNV